MSTIECIRMVSESKATCPHRGTSAQEDSSEGRYHQDLWFVWSLCPQGRNLGNRRRTEGGSALPTMKFWPKKIARHEVVEIPSSVPRKLSKGASQCF